MRKKALAKAGFTKARKVRPFASVQCPASETNCRCGEVLVCRIGLVDRPASNTCMPNCISPIDDKGLLHKGHEELLDIGDCDCLYRVCCVERTSGEK